MNDLLKSQNKLVQAIRQKDSSAIRNILENEPHLNNTVENGYTPLMYAVMRNAPDDVLENMIETATVENLEHETPDVGFTILHYLVHYARVSALRRVLQRTNTKINTLNNRGYTPLHYCLNDWGTTRSYEDHKEVAIVLITYGASASIKNKRGRTPLDLYDENDCRGYRVTKRIEKKKELRDLLRDLSTPSEILYRGADAVKAFKDALENGEITVVNSRLMFLGKEGSGKTSCVKAMLGKDFNENEPPTDGIVTTTVFQIVSDDYRKWEEQKDVDVCEQTKLRLEHGIAADVARKLKQTKSEQNTSKFVSDVERPSSSSSVASTYSAVIELPEAVMPQTSQRRSKEKSVTQDTGVSSQLMTYEIRKKIVENLANKSSRPSDITCIWDYAGQMTYYITHRVFLTDGSSYGVVFSLLDDLDEFAKPRDIFKGHFEMTNLQMIIFWIRSVYEHAVLLHGTNKKPLIKGMIASPPISLIGTHKDLLRGSDAELLIKGKFDRIFKELEDTPYESHVDRNMYAVANNAKMDEGIERLKTNVGGYMKAMARTVPINWMNFQIKVLEAGKTTMSMSLKKITEIASNCGINEKDLIHVLNYLTDLGVILYYSTNQKLKNTVITNIHMLISIFMKIITVVKPNEVAKVPVMVKYWRDLDQEGILAEPLVRYFWKNELAASKDDIDVIFEDCIEIMKVFGLLFEKTKSKEGARLFVVPSRMKTEPHNRLDIKKDEMQTVSIYVTPKDFLPDAVYDILVVRFVILSQGKGYSDDPKLFQNQSTIRFDDKHYLRLGRISIDNKPSLKLEISQMIETDSDGTDKPACKPHPGVCQEVLNVLKQNLDEIYPSKEVVGYHLKILCSCSTPAKLHFQELAVCLDKEHMVCDKTGVFKAISTANVRKLFGFSVVSKGKVSHSDQFETKKLKTCDKFGEQMALKTDGVQNICVKDIQRAPHLFSSTITSHPSSATDTPQPSTATDTPHPSSATDTPHPSWATDTPEPSTAMDTPHPSSASDTTQGPACSEMSDFIVLKAVVSRWYDSHQSLPMLKVLFRDKLENEELSKVTDTMDLLNILFARGHLSAQNLGLLCDTITITKHLELRRKIKERLPSFPDVKEGTNPVTFTPHRQKLMKFGMVLTPADVTQIDGLYNTPRKNYTGGWEMITDLEDRLIISKGNMTKFIDLLEILNLSQAMNALTT